MTALGILQYAQDHLLCCRREPGGHLRTGFVNPNAIPIVAHAPIKGRMNPEFNGHRRWLSSPS
jgi:hypothetical protein